MCRDMERRSELPKVGFAVKIVIEQHASKKHRIDHDESDEEYNVEEDNDIPLSSE